jgi:hypothetical protein
MMKRFTISLKTIVVSDVSVNKNDFTAARLIYLPPYSPNYKPIEQAFHSIKAWLCCHDAQALCHDARPSLIHQAALATLCDQNQVTFTHLLGEFTSSPTFLVTTG